MIRMEHECEGVRIAVQTCKRLQEKPRKQYRWASSRYERENSMDKKELTENTMGTEMEHGTETAAVSGREESTGVQAASGVKCEDEKPVAPEKEAEPEVFLQYREYEVTVEAVTERVKAHYYAKGYPKNSIKDMQIYMKPEEFTAYYVINDGIVGKVNLF